MFERPESALGNTAPETRLLAARNRYLAAGSTAGSCLLESADDGTPRRMGLTRASSLKVPLARFGGGKPRSRRSGRPCRRAPGRTARGRRRAASRLPTTPPRAAGERPPRLVWPSRRRSAFSSRPSASQPSPQIGPCGRLAVRAVPAASSGARAVPREAKALQKPAARQAPQEAAERRAAREAATQRAGASRAAAVTWASSLSGPAASAARGRGRRPSSLQARASAAPRPPVRRGTSSHSRRAQPPLLATAID